MSTSPIFALHPRGRSPSAFVLAGTLALACFPACGGGGGASTSDAAGTGGNHPAGTGGASGLPPGEGGRNGATGGAIATGGDGTPGTAGGGTSSTETGGAAGRLGPGGGTNGRGTGGAVGGGGLSGTGGGFMGIGSTKAPCNFASGLNVAWVTFARDLPNPNLAAFRTLFQNTFAAGGRVARWWLHTNGTSTPGYDGSGRANPISQATIDGVKNVLAAANAAGVSLVLSLWSFDMLQGNIASGLRTNNQNLLTIDANRQAYVDNVLIPLVNALRGNPGLYAYEIFNEPEGMTNQNGWTRAAGGTQVDEMYIQKTVNWFAAAIHSTDPAARVTNAAWTFKACSNLSNMNNYYSDGALFTIGGKSNGVLDFFEVHYYAANGAQYSPFLNPASHWGLEKKLVMGEFFARATDGVAAADLYTSLFTAGYNGAWAWQYNDGNAAIRWPTMQAPLQNLYSAHMTDVSSCR